MTEIFDHLGSQRKVVAVTATLQPHELLADQHYKDIYDPHVWFDLDLWKKMVEEVLKSLVEADPVNQEFYQSNAREYLHALNEFHQQALLKVSELPESKRVLITAHDAFRYFARAFGFEVVGLQGVSTESEAGVKDVANLAEMIVKRQLKAIFVESSVPERQIRAVQEAVKSRGWQVSIGGELYSDALGSADSPEGEYIGMFNHNINTIVEALK
jgi:manganese/zinc/iron transport system substrate-binding protein